MPDRPTGTVTFLFTDIEGSTKLWERYPDAMKVALARHDAILRQAIESHNGYVFKTVGDAFCAAFTRATDALAAVFEAQQALLLPFTASSSSPEAGQPALPSPHLPGKEGGESVPIRVRAGLHTGMAEERDGDYFGPAVNRVARLMSAGHGGQTLLSQPTYELLQERLPAGASVRDLGERRLKDLIRPERIYQFMMPGWPTEFPALKTLDARPNNLPAQLTVLVGRDAELERCRERLRRGDVRLLTLTGPGGIGKTRLALQVATEMIDEFEDGAFFVPLTTTDPDLVLSDIAQALGVREASGQTMLASLRDALRDKNMLVVVDNFEQVIAAAPMIAELLAAAPRVKFSVTSEIVLRVRGENTMRLEPLSLPRRGRTPPLDELLKYAAIALFVQRAIESKADFRLTEDNAAAVVEICQRLDGLPLAIELAAARIKVLNPQTMLNRLENSLKLLTGGARDLPSRQQTIRNAISWSYDLLEEREKRAFARLAVFVGGFSLEAAEAIINAQGDLEQDILDEISSLLDKSLVRQGEEVNGEPHFSMLRTVREFSLEQLADRGELEDMRQNHAAYYRALAEEAEPKLTGAQQAQWLNRLEAEHSNLRAALDWLAESGDDEGAWAMGGALWRFWSVRGHFSEGRACLANLLEIGPLSLKGTPASLRQARAKLVQSAGTLAAQQGDYPAARELYEESLALRRDLGDKRGTANLLNNLGVLARFEGDLEMARARYEESLALLRTLNDRAAVGQALNNLGLVLRYQGDLAEARQSLEESLRLRRQLKDKWGIANSLSSLGDLALEQGDFDAAQTFLNESLTLNLELGDRRALAFDLEYLAGLAAARGGFEYAIHLLGAAAALREEIQAPLSPAEEVKVAARLRPARDAVGDTAYFEALAVGRTISLDAAIGEAFGAVSG
ncbi:MAG: tetratricopeptide repeat protein [Anaerolineae bacterium]|nr:tetratricopeptide repeat protein [Anaerolineae bacterium]